MKYVLILSFFTAPLFLFSQVLGNHQSQVANYSNAVFNNVNVPTSLNLTSENTMEFTIRALSNQKASSYVAIFNVVQLGKTADSTNIAMNTRINACVSEMKANGIQAQDIYIDMVNFLPKYEYDISKKLFSKKNYKEIPIGFELQKNIHVRFHKPEQIEAIVSAAAKQEIYDIVKVDYFIENQKQVYGEIRRAVIKYIEEIKKDYTALMPMDSAYTMIAENRSVSYPGNLYESYQAFSSQKLDPNKTSNSKINKADKPISRFYNAIPGNSYDIIINPEILEPSVQFSLSMKVKFTLPERKPAVKKEREKEFILVTPEGVTRTLKIE